MPFNGVLLKIALVVFTHAITSSTFAQDIAKSVWGLKEIRASQITYYNERNLPDSPVFNIDDPLDLILIKQDAHHVSLFDTSKFESLHRFKSRFVLHGEPSYSPSRRFAYFVSADGWISKFDIFNLKLIAEIRAGIKSRHLAVSADGRYLLVANYQPHSLVLLDAKDLSPIKFFEVKDVNGKSSRVSAVYTVPPRNSFIVALKDIPELWEMNYEDEPPPGFGIWVHDYREDSGEKSTPEQFPLRKINLKGHLDDLFFDQDYISIVGVSAEGRAQVADMDIGRVIVKDLGLPGTPQPGSGVSWEHNDQTVLAIPNLTQAVVSIIDMETWKTIKQIVTSGPASVMSSHQNSFYVWVNVFAGINMGAVHIIDKRTLEIVKTLRPAPATSTIHIEFTRNGGHVLLSRQEPAGVVMVYDANTLEKVK